MRHASRYFLILLCLSLAPMVRAQTSLLVAMHIQSTRIDLTYPAGIVHKTEFNSLSLLWDEPLASWLDGHIKIGMLDVTQSSNPIVEAQSTSGQSLELGMHIHLFRSKPLQLYADLGYQYANTRSSQSGQDVELSWQQLTGQIGANIHLFQYSYVSLTAGTLAIYGKERASGTVNSTLEFDAREHTFGTAGMVIGLDQNSHIGIEVSTGAIRGGHIYFQRWF